MTKKVIFACATGVATSTYVAQKVVEHCESNGVFIEYEQSNVASLEQMDGTADLIVATTVVPYELRTPVMNGTGILTGIGEEELLNDILAYLKKE